MLYFPEDVALARSVPRIAAQNPRSRNYQLHLNAVSRRSFRRQVSELVLSSLK